jgi:hypothetical protein
MDMQDKEFDHLLNSKLDNFEIEPSPVVWGNIASELHGKKAKRSIVPYLSIAASIIILISVGLLFFRKAENNAVKPTKPSKTIVKLSKPAVDSLVDNNVDAVPEKATTLTNDVKQAKKYIVFKASRVVVDKEPSQKSIKDNGPALVYLKPIDPGPMPAVTEPIQIPVMVVPDKETSMAVITDDKQQIETITPETTSTEIMETPVKKRAIHSLGGLIGALVAKVDKREDKLIEFTERDENGSTITGLNLGFVRIKKK